MKKQWIVGTALLMLMTGNVRADGEPPTENILKDQFKKQYHGILKLDVITLKILMLRVIRPPGQRKAMSLPVTISIPGSVSWQITSCSNRPGRKINR